MSSYASSPRWIVIGSSCLAILGAGCASGNDGTSANHNAVSGDTGGGTAVTPGGGGAAPVGTGPAAGTGNAPVGPGGSVAAGGSGTSHPPGNAGMGLVGGGGAVAGGASVGSGGVVVAGGGTSSNGGATAGGGTGNGGAVAGGGASGGTGVIPHGTCLDSITDYTKDGPFMVTPKVMGAINFYVPSVPAGCKVPVIHLANGTGATCSVYQPALQRFASQGFLATCYESANTGAGDQGVQALDAAISMFPDLADNKFGSTGHSQGGQAAFTVLALAEKKYGDKYIMAGLAMEPASGFGTQPTGATWQQLYGQLKSPMFMFSGLGTDGLVSQVWVQEAYDATAKTEEAYFWTASGATHIPVPNGQEEEISIPWFRWKLLGDQKACAAFKAIPKTDTVWAEVASKNVQACL